MKKYLNLILLGCPTLFSVLIFATMAGAGVTVNGNSAGSYYELLDDFGGAVAALIFAILTLLVAGTLCALEVMKKPIGVEKFVAAAGVLFGLIAMILFFSAGAMAKDALGGISGYVKVRAGVGAVFSGIFALISTCGLACYTVKSFLNK